MIWFNKINRLYYRVDYELKLVNVSKDATVWTESSYSFEEFFKAIEDSRRFMIIHGQPESLENK